MAKDDEFRFDQAENAYNLSTLKEEMKKIFDVVNQNLLNFDSRMILEHASELHLNHFLELAVPSARIETCARKLPESLNLCEVLRGWRISRDADATLVADVLDFRKRVVAEMERWMPRPEVLQTALAFWKKPSSSKNLQRDHIIALNKEKTEDASRTEDEERRTAYESLRQDINLVSDAQSSTSKTSNQWLLSPNFMKFSKEKDIPQDDSMTYHRLNVKEFKTFHSRCMYVEHGFQC